MNLTEFLLARIAEDAEAARRAAFGYGAEWTSETDDGEDWSVVHADGKRDMVGCEDRDVTGHIARHDPARVLAKCEAKRRIVELHGPVEGEFHHGSSTGSIAAWRIMPPRGDLDAQLACATCGEFSEYGVPWPCETLRLLALPYADHSDYWEEWRP